MSRDRKDSGGGMIRWMIYNRVTPNLLMLLLLIGGWFVSTSIKKEVFPEFELDMVSVSVAYPGASPEEIEQGIVLAVERAIESVEGIKELTATAAEGNGFVRAELLEGAQGQIVMQDIEQEIDRISSFPEDAEDPVITLASHRRQVLRLNLYGDVSERELRKIVEQVKDQLLLSDGVTQVDISGGRDYELLVEIPIEKLRMYGLSLAEVASIIKNRSVDVPGGKLETRGGEVLLRVTNRLDWAEEFSMIPVITTAEGAVVYLGDIAELQEGFEDSTTVATYDRQRSMQLKIYRVGKQTPIGVSEAAREAMAEIERSLPDNISWSFTSDSSEVYKQRLELLLKNAVIGLVLVLVLLGLFLELKLAFWVTMGIPISFLGGLLFLPLFDISINMISMFAFIISLGIVVDDAIIAGENIYEYRQRGFDFIAAAIQGAKDVALPIAFSILTNVAAFLPLYFVPGVMGKIWKVIPVVVISVFLISWLESLLILPTHLAYSSSKPGNVLTRYLSRLQKRFSEKFSFFVQHRYGMFLGCMLKYKLAIISLLISLLIITGGYVFSGRIGTELMPRIESDRAVVTAVLPYGSPVADVMDVRDRLVDSVERVAEKNGGDNLVEGVSALISNNSVEVNAYLSSPDLRSMSTKEVIDKWRKSSGEIVGLQSLRFESDRGGPGSGAGLSVQLSHRDVDVLEEVSSELAEKLLGFSGVKDVDSGYSPGKVQFDFTVNERGASLGLTAAEVGRQVRNSFQGAVALRQQRSGNEVTVRVRLPEEQRNSEYHIENMLLITPAGTFVELQDVAAVKRGRAYTSIERRDGRRTVMVTANVEPVKEVSRIMLALNTEVLPVLAEKYAGLSYGYEGRQARRKESMGGLMKNFYFAIGGIYILLAIPFRSYLQPLVVMMAIPFGVVGAVIGHIIMGYSLSLMSMMGIVALSGIVVNDSLVLIDYANKQRRKGRKAYDSILAAGIRRFRPVILTTLTTFGGLAPMIFETSRQAKFLIPMALSLGFGVMFATVITLILVPCLYLVVEDLKGLF